MTEIRYHGPNTSAEYRASAQEFLDRAQRTLEVAEMNLDRLAQEINKLASHPEGVNGALVLSHAETRMRLGEAWAELAKIKWSGVV
jgi:hypothetical protein